MGIDANTEKLRLKLERGRLNLVKSMQRVNEAAANELPTALCNLGRAYLRLSILVRRARLMIRNRTPSPTA